MLQNVLDSLTSQIAVLDGQGLITLLNRAWRRSTEQTGAPGRQIGDNYALIYRQSGSTSNAQVAARGIEQVLRGEIGYFSMEYRYHMCPANKSFALRVFPLTGPRPGAVVAHEDTTDREQAQEQLRRERQRYLTFMKIAQDGIHLLDERGALVEANDAFLNMLGLPREAIGQLNVRDWDTETPKDELEGRLRALMDQPRLFQTRNRHRNGSILDVEIHAGGIELEAGLIRSPGS